MELTKLATILSATLVTHMIFAQAGSCAEANPICFDSITLFPASTNTEAETGPDYACLGSQPNPAWYYFKIADPGDLKIQLTNSENLDIDFICWGPFTTLSGACSLLTSEDSCASNYTYPCGNVVDCSFSTNAVEEVNIASASTGDYYVLMITNFSAQPTDIVAEKIAGDATTDCSMMSSSGLSEAGFSKVEIYPNPAAESLTINSSSNCEFRIYSSDGKLITEKQISGNFDLDVSQYNSGVYYVHLMEVGSEIRIEKILIE